VAYSRRKANSEIGNVIKQAREKLGKTQRDLAADLGLDYYTMISQMELSYIAVPPSLWVSISDALNLDRNKFILTCLFEYQPEVYVALFGNAGISDTAEVLKTLHD
jgi:transcriptional regulator with XRE-family HTH domain